MSDELLDLVVTARSEKVRFDVVDNTGRVIGNVHPEMPVHISCDANAQIKRTMTGFVLPPGESADIDPISHRIRPWWVLDDGDEYPLGVFLFAEASAAMRTYGVRLTATLVDLGLVLAQEIDRTVGFDTGTAGAAAIAQLLELAGIYDPQVSVSSSFELGSPIAWPAGSAGTTWAKVLDELCSMAGAYPAYFDPSGRCVVRTIDNVDTTPPRLDYSRRATAGSIVTSNDLLIAPNRYLAVDTSATGAAITAIFDVPDTAPHSYARRGFRITKVVEAPGVGDEQQAYAAAQAAYTSTPVAYEAATWSSPPDPRAGTFDIVRLWDNNTWLETSWSLTCAPGGPMTHRATRVYL